ncbi:Very-long-chain 3-oxoacyl-CoA reductase 1 [Vitis vinifera]|uniref:Very-long-chain 3-oxoacyl-CoA reductase 1 n=1 Tax=Vitis vinifera TaxID=29760 RepID=A0A438GKC2_VITVI|nr:Very-long-chain 3-oxoacyl-CoA reductase 1 [Vitis vinifera]
MWLILRGQESQIHRASASDDPSTMELPDLVLMAASILGFIALCKTLVRLVRWAWTMFLRPPKNLKEYGSWALVTGSTDGIGKAMAFELASKGLSLVLVGRNPCKLEAVSNEIRERHGEGVEVKNIVIDFAKLSEEEIARRIDEGIKGMDVVFWLIMWVWHTLTRGGTTWVTRSVLPGMLKKKKGAIINIGSASVWLQSYPLATLYAATKAYMAMFSKSISMEYRQYGIDVQCQFPLLVATKMTLIKRSSLFIPSPETFSKASIRCFGYEHECTPYWPHSVQWYVSSLLPNALLDWCVLRYFLGMRTRGQAKERRKSRVNQQDP